MKVNDKIIKELNNIFKEMHLVKAIDIEQYQEPHNYVPSAKFLGSSSVKDITIEEIDKYEKINGSSCGHRDINNKPCSLLAKEHIMKQGVVILIKKGTPTINIVDELCKVKDILERHNIDGIAEIFTQGTVNE